MCLLSQHQDRVWGIPNYSVTDGRSLSTGKATGHETAHLPSNNAEVKNTWTYISNPPIRPYGVVTKQGQRQISFLINDTDPYCLLNFVTSTGKLIFPRCHDHFTCVHTLGSSYQSRPLSDTLIRLMAHDARTPRGAEGQTTYNTFKCAVDSFRMHSVLLTEGSITDTCYEVWEWQAEVPRPVVYGNAPHLFYAR